MLSDLIKSGDIERLLIVLIVFGTIAGLYLTGRLPDDRLIDFGLVILGFFFGSIAQKRINGSG